MAHVACVFGRKERRTVPNMLLEHPGPSRNRRCRPGVRAWRPVLKFRAAHQTMPCRTPDRRETLHGAKQAHGDERRAVHEDFAAVAGSRRLGRGRASASGRRDASPRHSVGVTHRHPMEALPQGLCFGSGMTCLLAASAGLARCGRVASPASAVARRVARRPNPVHVFASVVHRRRGGRTAAPARASVPGRGGMRAEPTPAWARTATDRLEAGAPRPVRKQPQAPFPALVHRVNQP